MKRVDCPIRCVTPRDDARHYFFGYYDKCPWSPLDGDARMLAHRAEFVDRVPGPDDVVELGFLVDIDSESPRFESFASTTAWNWQQGAQLRWLADGRVMHNDRRDGRLISVIRSAEGAELGTLDWPMYAVSADGRTGVTCSFARLYDCRMDYGVAGLSDPNADVPAPDDDGVHRVDLATGRRTLLASVAEAMRTSPNPMGVGRKHWVNHLMFNPSGDRLCFLHRFDRADGIMHTRLLTVGIDGGDLRLLFEGLVSHFDWRDDRTILAWAGRRKLLGSGGGGRANPLMTLARRTLKPIYYALGKPRILMQKIVGDAYHLIPDASDEPATTLARGVLTCDGHCTFSPDRRWILTDGYPDQRGRQPLFLWDVQADEGREIGRYSTPASLDGPIRVDLHPRFDRRGGRVCIDSAMDGTRRMYVVDVSSLAGAGGLST